MNGILFLSHKKLQTGVKQWAYYIREVVPKPGCVLESPREL